MAHVSFSSNYFQGKALLSFHLLFVCLTHHYHLYACISYQISCCVVLGFYVPSIAKVIRRRDLGLKSHSKDWKSPESNPHPWYTRRMDLPLRHGDVSFISTYGPFSISCLQCHCSEETRTALVDTALTICTYFILLVTMRK